jgi:hypothetical protein
MRGRYWLPLVALGVLFVAACGAHPVLPNSALTGYVPWLPLPRTGNFPQPPSPVPVPPIPIPAGTPACQATQLEGVYLGGSGAGGNTDTPVAVRNNSATACWLEGYPDITILDSANRVLASAIGAANRGTYFGSTGPFVQLMMLPGTSPFSANAAPRLQMERGEAYVNIQWYDCQAPHAARLSLGLPDSGGSLIIPFPVAGPYSAACDAGTMPNAELLRDAFVPGGIQWPPSPDYLTVNFSISGPASVKHGAALVYFVTITNASSTDYVLTPCPDYGEFLGGKTAYAGYRLNCAPVGHIAPGSSAKFEMRLDLPSDISPGSNQLTWSLYDGRLNIPVAHATIDVT